MSNADQLRVALVAGTLAKGGAETQLVLIARALKAANVDVQVYCSTQGEFYESELCELGCQPIWYGNWKNPLSRVISLTRLLRRFRPHVIQSTHFYTNLYTALAGRILGCLAFGCLRSDVIYEVEANGRWGPWLLKLPKILIANSYSAQANVTKYGLKSERVVVLPNVVDLQNFDRLAADAESQVSQHPTAITICRMIQTKRLDRFLDALQLANQRTIVNGLFVGDGPERAKLEKHASDIHLSPDRIQFVGWRNDIPQLLRQAQMLVICSDHEGFPNVVLEAMAAAIPTIGTPAGDVPRVIDDNVTGFVVPFDDVNAMADRMVEIATGQHLGQRLGAAGRKRVESEFSPASIVPRLMDIYRDAVTAQGRTAIEPLLSSP